MQSVLNIPTVWDFILFYFIYCESGLESSHCWQRPSFCLTPPAASWQEWLSRDQVLAARSDPWILVWSDWLSSTQRGDDCVKLGRAALVKGADRCESEAAPLCLFSGLQCRDRQSSPGFCVLYLLFLSLLSNLWMFENTSLFHSIQRTQQASLICVAFTLIELFCVFQISRKNTSPIISCEGFSTNSIDEICQLSVEIGFTQTRKRLYDLYIYTCSLLENRVAHTPHVEANFTPALAHREPLSWHTVDNYQEFGARKWEGRPSLSPQVLHSRPSMNQGRLGETSAGA